MIINLYILINHLFLAQAEILTRTSHPSEKTMAEAVQSLDNFDIDMSEMINYNQEDCFIRPVLKTYSNSYLENLKQSKSS